MKKILDWEKFGPWAIITGASSGIGKEFAQQLALNGFNLVLVARRKSILEDVGKKLKEDFGIEYLTIEVDLSEENSIEKIVTATNHLEIGLLISNAGTGNPGKFLSFKENDLKYIMQLNAISHLSLIHYFAKKMAIRKKGGVLLTGAMGASDGVPYMSNEAGTKGYILSLGKSLHVEFQEYGIHLTVLNTSPTETPVLKQLGFTETNMPMNPISVNQCVKEALKALKDNQIVITPGRKFRIMNAIIPGFITRKMMGSMMKKNNNLF